MGSGLRRGGGGCYAWASAWSFGRRGCGAAVKISDQNWERKFLHIHNSEQHSEQKIQRQGGEDYIYLICVRTV